MFTLRSMQEIKAAHGHKIKANDFLFCLSGYDPYDKRHFLRKQAPLKMLFERFEVLINGKRMQWTPFIAINWSVWDHKYTYKVQKHPIVLWDLDDNVPTEVKEKADKIPSLVGKNFLITSSLHGKTHISLQIDLSHIKEHKKLDYSKHEDVYKESARFQEIERIYLTVADELDNIGLIVDRGAFHAKMAYVPDEVAEMHHFFKDKKPVRFENIKEIIKKEKQPLLKTEIRLDPFFCQYKWLLADMIIDSDVLNEVMNWNVKYGTGNASKMQNMIHAAEKLLSNIQQTQEHMKENWREVLIYASKKLSLGVGCRGVMKMLGFEDQTYMTEIRRIILYVLNLKMSQKHVIKRTTDEFDYMPNMETKTYFKSSFLEKYWWKKTKSLDLSPQNILNKLGNGNTYNTIFSYLPRLVNYFGRKRAVDVMNDCLELSNANDKSERRSWIRGYARYIEYQMDLHGEVPLAA